MIRFEKIPKDILSKMPQFFSPLTGLSLPTSSTGNFGVYGTEKNKKEKKSSLVIIRGVTL
ncbi:MAG: hypothetical protein ACP5MB_05300 [bacterium]